MVWLFLFGWVGFCCFVLGVVFGVRFGCDVLGFTFVVLYAGWVVTLSVLWVLGVGCVVWWFLCFGCGGFRVLVLFWVC